MRLKLALPLFVLAACDDPVGPNPNPPETWGVPISGGNMLVAANGHAVVADPDRDRILAVDLAAGTVVEVALNPGDEPGRLVEDAAGRIHVALRRGNAVVTLADAASAQIIGRRAACNEPRGLAFDPGADAIHVACATGELVSLPAAGGEATRRLRLDRDLRDVVMQGDQLVVTRFRTAEVLTLDATGAVTSRFQPPIVRRLDTSFDGGGGSGSGDGLVDAIPTVAWRTITVGDRLVMTHQRQLQSKLDIRQTGGYGGGCGSGPVEASLTTVRPGGAPFAVAPLFNGALPVDIAVNRQNTEVAVALAGSRIVQRFPAYKLDEPSQDGQCSSFVGVGIDDKLGAPTSIGFTQTNELAIFYPEVPAIAVHTSGGSSRTINLPGELGYDSGRNLFHASTSVGLACASCHPEGRDDGLIWDFEELGKRRTQSLAGGILSRAPYHWNGDMTDLSVLMSDVFANRMAGGEPTRSQKLSLGPWLDRIPAPLAAPAADPAAVARGRALFDSAALNCTSCHSGQALTNNQLVNVGTGGNFKVPSLLGVAARAPFMHDGCAPTLADRFGTCGGGDAHGVTSQLAAAQLADLVSFLETL
jgi:mono/diheme cytochrome c family protein